MRPAELPSIKSPRLLRVAGWLFAIVAILLMLVLWPTSDDKARSPKGISPSSHTSSRHDAFKPAESSKIATQLEKPTKSSVRREAPRQSVPVTTYSAIGELLANDQLSQDEAALQLAKIALDSQVAESDRLEAMDHGKNLGFGHMLPLSMDPNLPLPLAESFLHGLHGHDQIKEQISGALGLLIHSDPDIRQQAQALLGFLLKAEEDTELPDKLREKADAFLKQPDEESEEGIGQ